jgi:glycosyltransferase involved in cell wall biosynthesis
VHATEFDRTANGEVNRYVYDVERAGMHAASRVVSVSNYTKGTVVRHYGVAEGKISVVHNGVDPREATLFPKSRLADHYRIILFLGRLTVQGPDWFLRAAKLVLETSTRRAVRHRRGRHGTPGHPGGGRDGHSAENVIFTGFRRGRRRPPLPDGRSLRAPVGFEPFGITRSRPSNRARRSS